MALLVKVFLAMFALHLAPPVICNDPQFQFGDMIAINYQPEGNPPVPAYIHWAVYVGEEQIADLNGKSKEEDIFHIYGGQLFTEPLCVFDTLKELSGTPEVLNYLDKDKNGKEHMKPLAKDDMIKEIVKLHKNCKWWDPAMNNCEIVLATVRYGSQNIKCEVQ